MKLTAWLAACAVFAFCSQVYAAAWKDATHSDRDCGGLVDGGSCSWDETGTTDSGAIYIGVPVTCDDTGATDFTVYRAKSDGTKLHIWLGPIQNGVDCSGLTTCGSVELDPGWYVFDPDAAGANAICYATKRLK